MQELSWEDRVKQIVSKVFKGLDQSEESFKTRIKIAKSEISKAIETGNFSEVEAKLSSIGSRLRHYLSGSYGARGLDDHISWLLSDASESVRRMIAP